MARGIDGGRPSANWKANPIKGYSENSISNQLLVLLLARLSSTGQMANIFFHYQAFGWIQTNDVNINSPGSWSLKPPAFSPPREILFK